MKSFLIIAALCALLWPAFASQTPSDYPTLRARAEELYAQGSFELARRAYAQAAEFKLDDEQRLWVRLRLADTRWRSASASQNADTSEIEAAKAELDALARELSDVRLHDRTWAELQESLGDLHWTRRDTRDLGSALPHYREALEWWAAARDIEAARGRYLALVWRMAWPQQNEWSNGWWYGQIPLEYVENALRIARSERDRAQAQYLYALTVRNLGRDYDEVRRGFDALQAALQLGKATPWYDDALFLLAQWLEQNGVPVSDEQGAWKVEPDYVRALAAYQRLLEEFKKGESAYVDQARAAIERIRRPELALQVAGIFLPGSQIAVSASTRNIERIDLALYAVDLTRAVQLSKAERGSSEWLASIDVRALERTRSWSESTGDDGRHRPSTRELQFESALAPGAYVLEARSGGVSARELVLVSQSALIMKAAGDKALLWFVDASSSAPIADARVRLFEKFYDGRRWQWRSSEATTGADGTALVALNERADNTELFAAATLGDAQAFALGSNYANRRGDHLWRIYATTDRSTYKPGDLVQWKITARTSRAGVYATPAGAKLEYEIFDARGTRVQQDTLTLNAFGSAWTALETTASMALGEYRIQFYEARAGKSRESAGDATLFRFEEYKLPEFEVKVAVPERAGQRKLYRTGERVEVAIEAAFYYGAPVASAQVEALVHQRPHWRRPIQPREYGWLYEDFQDGRYGNYGGDQIVQRTLLTTDAHGRATLVFPTPRDAGGDLEFTIEARVTDASRREITGRGTVVVARRAYSVAGKSERNLYRPDDRVRLTFQASDANGAPVEARGEVVLTRERWSEVWLDPTGREVAGEELDRLRARGNFPPAGPDAAHPWRLKSSSYVAQTVATEELTCNARGEALWEPKGLGVGYYRAAWTSRDDRGASIDATLTFIIADGSTSELGYHSGGLDVIVDKDTFRSGEQAAVLLVTTRSNRWVLLSVESEALHSFQVVHLEGNVKLVALAIGVEHVPNFTLSALTTDAGDVLVARVDIVVPPVEQFLTVEIASDKSELLPGEQGTLRITTRDHSGEPVAAEVGLAVTDAAIAALQSDYAIDPRQFFYGERRALMVQLHSTFEQRRYVKLVRDDKGVLRDERQARLERSEQLKDGFDDERDGLAKYGFRSDGPAAPGAAGARRKAEGGDFMLGMVAESKMRQAAPSVAGAKELASDAAGEGGSVVVRSNFSETALWKPDLATDARGEASIDVTYPDSLTRWQALARVVGRDARFGSATLTTRTNKPLIARLQGPRFFVVGDRTLVSALIDNRTETELTVAVELAASGVVVTDAQRTSVTIEAGGEARVDWKVEAREAGEARLRISALSASTGAMSAGTGAESTRLGDAMEKSFTVHPHGIDALVARSAKLAGDEIVLTLDVPAERRRETTRFEIDVAPSLALAMLDALPYLIDYPYGCTEQTLSRFVPATIVAKTLADLGLSRESTLARVFGGIEPETAGKTHPKGARSLSQLDDITRAGLARLYDFQHQDGGFGWWKNGESDHYMSAYAVWSLTLARDGGVNVDGAVLDRAAHYLELEIVEEERNPDLAAWMLHALAACRRDKADEHARAAFDNLWAHKNDLNAFGKALLALAAHAMGRASEARTLVDNLANGAQIDVDANGSRLVPNARKPGEAAQRTAHWGADRIWWRWSEGGVETTSFVLRALLAIDPKNELVEPSVAWLIGNRRGAQWNNTRDSAIALLSLTDYLKTSGELARDVEYELSLNGRSLGRRSITRAEMLAGKSVFEIAPGDVRDGANEVRLTRVRGEGPLYLSARARFFSLEEPVTARGNQLFAQRRYYKLVGRPTLLKGEVYERLPLADQGEVASGERVEVVLTLESKNDLEYLLFEDLKPAGLEAAQLKSGEFMAARELKSKEFDRVSSDTSLTSHTGPAADALRFTGREAGVHQELRERKVALFIDKLPQGIWELSYELRAEVPGEYHAPPVLGSAMYVPEIRCNGDELRIAVREGKSQ